jgi:acyl-coenzyme A thioesterase PaaI-like protein
VLLVAKKFQMKSDGFHPFGELIGLNFSRCEGGFSRGVLEVDEKLFNPHNVLHGGVVYTMADTGMGAAVYSCLNPRYETMRASLPRQQGRTPYFEPGKTDACSV